MSELNVMILAIKKGITYRNFLIFLNFNKKILENERYNYLITSLKVFLKRFILNEYCFNR